MNRRGGSPLVTVAVAYSRPELLVLLAFLRANRIWPHADGAAHASVDWPITVALGGIEVRVHRDQAAEAANLLSTIERSFYRGGLFARSRWADIAIIALMLLAGALAPPARIPAFFLDPRHVERKAEWRGVV